MVCFPGAELFLNFRGGGGYPLGVRPHLLGGTFWPVSYKKCNTFYFLVFIFHKDLMKILSSPQNFL